VPRVGPKQPSLKDQIVDAIKDLMTEEKRRQAETDDDNVREYTSIIYDLKTKLPELLKTPLPEVEDYDDYRMELETYSKSTDIAFRKIENSYNKHLGKSNLVF
jgi:hypothetical protein